MFSSNDSFIHSFIHHRRRVWKRYQFRCNTFSNTRQRRAGRSSKRDIYALGSMFVERCAAYININIRMTSRKQDDFTKTRECLKNNDGNYLELVSSLFLPFLHTTHYTLHTPLALISIFRPQSHSQSQPQPRSIYIPLRAHIPSLFPITP